MLGWLCNKPGSLLRSLFLGELGLTHGDKRVLPEAIQFCILRHPDYAVEKFVGLFLTHVIRGCPEFRRMKPDPLLGIGGHRILPGGNLKQPIILQIQPARSLRRNF
jgi:hypothetical protein